MFANMQDWNQSAQLQRLLFNQLCSAHGFLLVLLYSIKILSKLYLVNLFPFCFLINFTSHELTNRNSAAESWKQTFTPDFTMLSFWREVACVPAFLNVIDVMTGARCQNGAIRCILFLMQISIIWDSGSIHFSVGRNLEGLLGTRVSWETVALQINCFALCWGLGLGAVLNRCGTDEQVKGIYGRGLCIVKYKPVLIT